MELPDMAEEEIDVQEACDAGLVDREDLVDERSELLSLWLHCHCILAAILLLIISPSQPALISHTSMSTHSLHSLTHSLTHAMTHPPTHSCITLQLSRLNL